MKQRHFIDTHKVATGLGVFGMMAWHSSWDHATAWIYLALHGTYGLLWVWKSRTFPDKSWEERCTVVYGLTIWAGLSLYWIAPWIVTSGGVEPPPWYLAACITLWGLGVFLHFASDMHKNIALQLRPEHLVHTGLWARCRNPNYLGELFIYLGFGLLAMHWLPLTVIALFLVAVWIPNMLKKDQSLARYPEFEAYKARSWLLLPPLI